MKEDESIALCPDPLDPELNDPESLVWKEADRIHNWQNYVGERTRAIWNSLTDKTKRALTSDAYDSAMKEEWD